jgi:O-antigen/teichoic acid export membrane protein
MLGSTIKGDATIYITTITFIVFFCNIIGGQALIYLLPRLQFEKLIFPAYVWTLLIGLSFYFIFSVFHFFTQLRSLNIVILAIITSLVSIHSTILLSKKEIEKYNLLQALPIALTVLGLIVSIYVFEMRTIYAFIYPTYFAYIITLLVSIIFCYKYFKRSSFSGVFEELDSSFKYGGGYQLAELFQLLNFRFYFYLLYFMQGPSGLGYFSLGVSLVEVVWIFARSISIVNYNYFSAEMDSKKLVQDTLRYLKLSLLFSFIGLLMIISIPKEIYGMIFGENFQYVKYVVKWLYPGVFTYNIMLVIQSFYLSKGTYSKLIFANITGFIVAVAVCHWLIPNYYFSGASAGASISFILSSFIILLFFIRDNRLSIADFIISKQDFLFINNVFKSYFKRG